MFNVRNVNMPDKAVGKEPDRREDVIDMEVKAVRLPRDEGSWPVMYDMAFIFNVFNAVKFWKMLS